MSGCRQRWIGWICIVLVLLIGNTGFDFKGISGNWVVVEEQMKYNARVFILRPDNTFSTFTNNFQPFETKGQYYVDFSKNPVWIDFEAKNNQYRTEAYLQVVNNNRIILYTNGLIPLEPVYLGGQIVIPKRPISLDRSVYTLTLRRMK